LEEDSHSNSSIKSIKKYQSQLNLEIIIPRSSLLPHLRVPLRCRHLNPIQRKVAQMAQLTHIWKQNPQIN